MKTQTRPRHWRKVTMGELRAIWADLKRRNICYCGCTWAELHRRYGAENVRHNRHGWLKLTEGE